MTATPAPGMPSRPSVRLRTAAGGAALLAGVLALGACGGASQASGAGTPAAAATNGPGAGGTNGGAPGFGQGRRDPGVSGLVAAVSGHTMQVQSTDSQTAVSWTGSTTFTATTAARLADVKVGACVMARPAVLGVPGQQGGGGQGGAPTTPTTAPTSVAAATVAISAATQGRCGGPGGFGGGGFSGFGRPDDRPTGAGQPTGRPSGAPSGGPGRGFFGGGAFGTVVSVSGSTITVRETTGNRPGATATTTAAPRTVTLTVSATTSYTRTTKASASAVVVGRCVTALGKADDTGAVTATTVSVRPQENGSCTFGRGFRGGAGGAGAAPTTGGVAGA